MLHSVHTAQWQASTSRFATCMVQYGMATSVAYLGYCSSMWHLHYTMLQLAVTWRKNKIKNLHSREKYPLYDIKFYTILCSWCVCFCLAWCVDVLIWASLSKPHTSELNCRFVRISSVCLLCISMTFNWTSGWHLCITISRHGMYFWHGQPCATKCEKGGKAYDERVPGSEWIKFQTPHQTQGYGRFSRWSFFASLTAALSYSYFLVRYFWIKLQKNLAFACKPC